MKEKALAYFRTSSAANVGDDKDSLARQRAAVESYAKGAGLEIADEFYDAAVSGDDALESRPGFAAMLDRIEDNGVRLVLVEGADRLARSVLTQELGIMALRQRGVRVLTASGQDLSEDSDPAQSAMRQVAAVFSEFEKRRLVAKLKAARDRKRQREGRCEGPKPPPPETVREARRLRRKSPKTGRRRSLRQIAQCLAESGHLAPSGRPYGPESVRRMVQG